MVTINRMTGELSVLRFDSCITFLDGMTSIHNDF